MKGRYGIHGGQYIPETLMIEIHKIEETYEFYKNDQTFNDELNTLLKEYAGSPRIFYEKDTTELKLDIDSVKQYSRVLSFLGVKNNEKYCIFIDNEKCGHNFNKSRFYGIVSAVRRVHLSPIGYGHYKYYMVFGEDTIPVDLNIQYYVCLKQK